MKRRHRFLCAVCAAPLSLLFSCAHSDENHRSAAAGGSRGHPTEREFNPQTGNYERQPPFGPRSNKAE